MVVSQARPFVLRHRHQRMVVIWKENDIAMLFLFVGPPVFADRDFSLLGHRELEREGGEREREGTAVGVVLLV